MLVYVRCDKTVRMAVRIVSPNGHNRSLKEEKKEVVPEDIIKIVKLYAIAGGLWS